MQTRDGFPIQFIQTGHAFIERPHVPTKTCDNITPAQIANNMAIFWSVSCPFFGPMSKEFTASNAERVIFERTFPSTPVCRWYIHRAYNEVYACIPFEKVLYYPSPGPVSWFTHHITTETRWGVDPKMSNISERHKLWSWCPNPSCWILPMSSFRSLGPNLQYEATGTLPAM